MALKEKSSIIVGETWYLMGFTPIKILEFHPIKSLVEILPSKFKSKYPVGFKVEISNRNIYPFPREN